LAEAVAPFPASIEVTAVVVFVCAPDTVPVTFTAKLHEALAARDAPDKLMLLAPATAVTAPLPQLPIRPLGVATTCPAGSMSVNPIPLREAALLGLVRVKVSDVAPFNGTLAAP
jgi:hypothetical protein